jgi:peptidoglycan/xylan/chitin deacetylase (PgdA/CDA1 family)
LNVKNLFKLKESIRYYFRDIFLRFAGSISRPKSGIHILLSHFASRSDPNYEMYCEFLQFLNAHCCLLRIEDSVEQIKHKITINDCLVSLTYDDGYEECHSIIAPALEEFNTNGAFFINGGFVNGDNNYKEYFTRNIVKVECKKPMTWLEIKDLNDRGHIIGSHTLDHLNMNITNYELIDFQLRKNKQLIEECTNKPCDFLAYPFGQFKHINNETLKLAEKYHKYIFSGTDYKNYYSFNSRVINRRHIESEWPRSYIKYFLSVTKKY